MSEQIERIKKYESIFREVKQLVQDHRFRSAEALIDELEAYYGSDVWKRDFADDEAGLLPADLKRGVLSEDGIYDLLEEYRELTGKPRSDDMIQEKNESRPDDVTKEQYKTLFLEMNPGYFEREYVRAVPDDEPASEMMLSLDGFDESVYPKTFDGEVTFGYYEGGFEELLEAVAKVVPHWTQFFGEDSRVYCGFVNGEIASFCQIEDFGEHRVGEVQWKIGGPGCVGTLPEYRDRGIGLSMVRNVTKILKDESYDHSYIHYTYETAWYGKLGYKTFLQWNGKGFV